MIVILIPGVLTHRLHHVCTRWPRVNEHKLITFAHQGNVRHNLIGTQQLTFFLVYLGSVFTVRAHRSREAVLKKEKPKGKKKAQCTHQMSSCILQTALEQCRRCFTFRGERCVLSPSGAGNANTLAQAKEPGNSNGCCANMGEREEVSRGFPEKQNLPSESMAKLQDE